MCSPASFETAYVQRASPTDPSLEDVVRPDDVHAHRPHRALEHGVDAGDRRAVDDVRGPLRQLRHRLGVEDVDLVEREVRVLAEIGAREGVPVEVVDRDDLVLVDEPAPERRRDEARAARDEDSLAL
jgi:hypothetical protein